MIALGSFNPFIHWVLLWIFDGHYSCVCVCVSGVYVDYIICFANYKCWSYCLLHLVEQHIHNRRVEYSVYSYIIINILYKLICYCIFKKQSKYCKCRCTILCLKMKWLLRTPSSQNHFPHMQKYINPLLHSVQNNAHMNKNFSIPNIKGIKKIPINAASIEPILGHLSKRI